jgi:hypothetical protein
MSFLFTSDKYLTSSVVKLSQRNMEHWTFHSYKANYLPLFIYFFLYNTNNFIALIAVNNSLGIQFIYLYLYPHNQGNFSLKINLFAIIWKLVVNLGTNKSNFSEYTETCLNQIPFGIKLVFTTRFNSQIPKHFKFIQN